MATLLETCQYYVSLLAIQYRQQPNARAQTLILAKQAVADMLASDLFLCFNVDLAVGAQLDIIGKYVGVSRYIGDPIARPYYQFSESDGTIRPNGFQEALDASVNAQAVWYDSSFLGTNNTALNDLAYRFVIQLQIILNSSNGTLASIQAYLHMFLPGVVSLVDNADMTLTYTVTNRIPIAPNVLKRFLPKPMGVGMIFLVLEADYPSPVSKTLTVSHGDHSLHTVTSDSQIISQTNGVGPYSYDMLFVSGDPIVQPQPVFPTTNHWRFFMQGVATVTRSAVYRGVVTDSRGLIAYTDPISVTLTIQEAP